MVRFDDRDLEGDEGIDFKPYFDMVIGILFLLLIIISAQLFFARYGDGATEAAQARREQRLVEWRTAVDRFLETAGAALRAQGIDATVDLPGRRLLVPAGDLIVLPTVAGQPLRPVETQTAAAARVLLHAVECVRNSNAIAAPGCPPLAGLSLDRFSLDALAIGGGDRAGQSPDRHAAAAAASLLGAFASAEPRLFDLRDAAGETALTSASQWLPAAQASTTWLQIRFWFRAPDPN